MPIVVFSRKSPADRGAALIEVVTGEAYPAGPQPEQKRLGHPRNKADPLYHRQWMLARQGGLPPAPTDHDESWQPDAAGDFDATGFELPPWRAPLADPRQGSLFPDYAGQAEPPESEPVFVLSGSQVESVDDSVQPDAPDSSGA